MKTKIITTLVFMMLSMQAFANDEQRLKEFKAEYCKEVYETAVIVMNLRQSGVSMPDLMGWTDGDELSTLMVETAFETPLYSTDEFKERAIASYSEVFYKACRKNFNGSN